MLCYFRRWWHCKWCFRGANLPVRLPCWVFSWQHDSAARQLDWHGDTSLTQHCCKRLADCYRNTGWSNNTAPLHCCAYNTKFELWLSINMSFNKWQIWNKHKAGAVLCWVRGDNCSQTSVCSPTPQMWHEELFHALKASAYRCKKERSVASKIWQNAFADANWELTSLLPIAYLTRHWFSCTRCRGGASMSGALPPQWGGITPPPNVGQCPHSWGHLREQKHCPKTLVVFFFRTTLGTK